MERLAYCTPKIEREKKEMGNNGLTKGTVKWFDVRKGFGFISDEDGVDRYVHFTNINMEGFKKLKPGQNVTFVEDEDEQGRQIAKEITIVEA